MPGSLFGVSLHVLAVPRQNVTDTAAPSTSPVPVYYFHSFDQPFCANVHCPCQGHRQAVGRLFVSLIEGRLDLEPVAALLTERGKEHRA
jgi:hypothetical protein